MTPQEIENVRETLEDAKQRFLQAAYIFQKENLGIIESMGAVGNVKWDRDAALGNMFYQDDNDNYGSAGRMLGELDTYEEDGVEPYWFRQL